MSSSRLYFCRILFNSANKFSFQFIVFLFFRISPYSNLYDEHGVHLFSLHTQIIAFLFLSFCHQVFVHELFLLCTGYVSFFLLITPNKYLSILSYATSSFIFNYLVICTASKSKIISGLIRVLKILCFVLAGIRLSHITLVTFLHTYHPS